MARGLGKNRRGFANSAVTRSVTSPIAGVELSDPVSIYLPFDSDVNDDSDNNHTVTAGGGAAISSTQSKFGGNSLNLDGTNDYLSVAASTDFDFGTGLFTIEGWIYSEKPQNDNLYSQGIVYSGATGAWSVSLGHLAPNSIRDKHTIQFYRYTSGSDNYNVQTAQTVTRNAWHHFAVVRENGTTIKIYVDGVLSATEASVASSAEFNSAGSGIQIGRNWNTTNTVHFVNGYIDDLRISKGIARYTKDFIPPSQAVGAKLSGTNETNTTTDLTSLYLPFDSDLNDDSTNAHSGTASGSAAISSTQAKFGGNSLSLNGTSQYVTYSNDADFQFGSGDFTIEAWIYQTADAGSSGSGLHPIVARYDSSSNRSFRVYIEEESGNQVLAWGYSTDGSTATNAQFNTNVTNNTWHHIAIVRSGSTITGYLDGVAHGTTQNVGSDSFFVGTSDLTVGYNGKDSAYFQGYIDDLRIVKGHAQYTKNFTPPTSAVGTSVSETVNDLAVLYLPFDDGSMEDQSRKHGITKEGTVALSTSVKKLGTSSAYFAAADDEIQIPGSKFDLGTSFTIEGWFYLTAYTTHSNAFNYEEIGVLNTNDEFILTLATSGNGSTGPLRARLMLNNGAETIWVGGNHPTDFSLGQFTTNAPALNTWFHIAFVRNGANLYLFKDGVQIGMTQTITNATLPLKTSGNHVLSIGGSTLSPTPYSDHGMRGYIDDFRIIDGHALYTSNFTPPTSPVGLAVESGGVTTNTVDNKFLSSVWSLKDQNKKINRGEWIRNDVADTGANGRGKVIKGAGLEDTNHRHYVAPPTVQIAWGSTYQGTDVQLSNSDLTAQIYQEGTSSWGQNAVVSVGTHSSGKVYFEAVVSGNPTSGYMRIGVVQNKGSAFNSTIQGGSMGSWGSDTPAYANKSENKSQPNGSDIDDGSDGFSDGDIVMWAFDIDNGLVYFGKNGTFDDRGLNGHSSFDPVNETGGFDMTSLSGYSSSHPWHILFQNLQFNQTPEHKVTLRLSSEEQYMPSGYSYWGTYVG